MVKYREKGILLNRRGEWGQNLPPKLTVNDGSLKGPKRAFGSCKGPGEESSREEGQGDPHVPPNHHQRKDREAGLQGSKELEIRNRVVIAPKVLTIKGMLRKRWMVGTKEAPRDL